MHNSDDPRAKESDSSNFSSSFFQQDNDNSYCKKKKEIQQFIYHESMISVTTISKTVNESTTIQVTTTIVA